MTVRQSPDFRLLPLLPKLLDKFWIPGQIRIPLKPEAIEIALAGPVADEGALSAIADRLLASLEGETNW